MTDTDVHTCREKEKEYAYTDYWDIIIIINWFI